MLACKHGNDYNPGLSPSFLLIWLCLLPAGLPSVFSCQELNLRPLEGSLVCPNPYLYCYIIFDLESLFGDQGSMVTLPNTLTVMTGLFIFPRIMCMKKNKMCHKNNIIHTSMTIYVKITFQQVLFHSYSVSSADSIHSPF